jgi:hypothetical protein
MGLLLALLCATANTGLILWGIRELTRRWSR